MKMDLFRKKKGKSKLEEEVEELYEVDEDSDLPVHEKLTKQKKIRQMK
ncbi:hypothetical protein JW898_05070 [Candidatus Woesearchaeota archaeon]|nr:hypothetical protein [Candidatus Woesearchaeota archaeon]